MTTCLAAIPLQEVMAVTMGTPMAAVMEALMGVVMEALTVATTTPLTLTITHRQLPRAAVVAGLFAQIAGPRAHLEHGFANSVASR